MPRCRDRATIWVRAWRAMWERATDLAPYRTECVRNGDVDIFMRASSRRIWVHDEVAPAAQRERELDLERVRPRGDRDVALVETDTGELDPLDPPADRGLDRSIALRPVKLHRAGHQGPRSMVRADRAPTPSLRGRGGAPFAGARNQTHHLWSIR